MGDKKTMGQRVRQAREAERLTQQELADAAGITRNAITAIESDETKSFRPENLFPIARRLRRNPEWLATGNGEEFVAEDIFAPLRTGELFPSEDRLDILEQIDLRVHRLMRLHASEKLAKYQAQLEEEIRLERSKGEH